MLKDTVPANTVELFQTEVLFREGEVGTLACSAKIVGRLLYRKRLRQGKRLNGYVIWLGIVKVDDHFEYLFAMKRI